MIAGLGRRWPEVEDGGGIVGMVAIEIEHGLTSWREGNRARANGISTATCNGIITFYTPCYLFSK